MFAAPKPQKMFPVFESYAMGLRLSVLNARLFFMLSLVPALVAFATLVVLRFWGDFTMFSLPLLQAPANFVQGLQAALILRYLLVGEFPLIADDLQRRERNREILRAGLVYTIVMYLFNGAMAALLFAARRMQMDPQGMAPFGPIMIAVLVLVFFAMRWFWLFVPVALGWDINGLYQRLRGWPGSWRIGGLFIICSMTINVLGGLLRYMVFILAGVTKITDLHGAWAVVDDMVVSVSSVAMGVLFACATAHAIRSMIGKDVTV